MTHYKRTLISHFRRRFSAFRSSLLCIILALRSSLHLRLSLTWLLSNSASLTRAAGMFLKQENSI